MPGVERGTSTRPDSVYPPWGDPADRLRHLVEYAVLAPSRNNAQPWLFDIDGEVLSIHGDHSRALRVVDPHDRQLVIACGAALANVQIAAAHFGRATSTEILASHRRDGLVARVRLEEQKPSTPDTEELFHAIPRRRTNRLALDSREPPDGLVAALVREARAAGAMLRPVEAHQRRAVAELVAEGDRLQWADARYRGELAAWTRRNGSARKDGLPGYATGRSDAAAFLRTFMLRFSNPGDAEAERDRRRALNSRALLLLSTRRDEPGDWVAAGEALQRVLLRACAAGLCASYLDQPIDVAELRGRLRLAVGEMGHPQVMVRLGYGLEVRPTPRRAADAVIRRVEHRLPRPQLLALRQ